jgi:PhnB protein
MTTPKTNPPIGVNNYLNFDGRCEEAVEFYKKALGAEVQGMLRFKESPEPTAPGSENKIMHASLKIGDTLLMMSDGHCKGHAAFAGFSLAAHARDAAEAERFFNALADGGQITMPLAKTFFSPSFGMLVDRFGVAWMVIVYR